jgi:hypothetical protein
VHQPTTGDEAGSEDSGEAEEITKAFAEPLDSERWESYTRPLISAAPETATHAKERAHFDLQRILAFVGYRMRSGKPCAAYRNPAVPSASPWRGSTKVIVEVLDESHRAGKGQLQVADVVAGVVSRWPGSGGETKHLAGS